MSGRTLLGYVTVGGAGHRYWWLRSSCERVTLYRAGSRLPYYLAGTAVHVSPRMRETLTVALRD